MPPASVRFDLIKNQPPLYGAIGLDDSEALSGFPTARELNSNPLANAMPALLIMGKFDI